MNRLSILSRLRAVRIALLALLFVSALMSVVWRVSRVATTGTFRTQNLIVEEQADPGDINHPTFLNGPTRQSLSIPGAGYPYGEVNQVNLTGATPDFPDDLFAYAIRNHATADTTTHTQHTGGMAVEVDGARTAGAFDKTNTAIECEAVNGQVYWCTGQ